MNKKSVLVFGIIAIIIIITVVIAILTNGNKMPTIEDFEQKATKKGFTISTIENAITQNKPITSAKMAVSSDSKYTVEMYAMENDNEAKTLYTEKKVNYEDRKQEGDKAKETNKDDVDIYTLKSNGNCMFIKRVKNTIISYNVKDSGEKIISEFVNSL